MAAGLSPAPGHACPLLDCCTQNAAVEARFHARISRRCGPRFPLPPWPDAGNEVAGPCDQAVLALNKDGFRELPNICWYRHWRPNRRKRRRSSRCCRTAPTDKNPPRDWSEIRRATYVAPPNSVVHRDAAGQGVGWYSSWGVAARRPRFHPDNFSHSSPNPQAISYY